MSFNKKTKIPLSAKFTIKKIGSTYIVYDEWGSKQYGTSSFKTALVDEAQNGLTEGRLSAETIVTQGLCEIDAQLVIGNLVDFYIQGGWKSVNSLNTDAIVNANQDTNNYGIRFRGFGYINGNGAYQSSGKLFYFKNATDPPVDYQVSATFPNALCVENLNIIYANGPDNCVRIELDGSAGSTIRFDRATIVSGNLGDSNYGVYLSALNDCEFIRCFPSGDIRNFYIIGGSANRFDFRYVNGCGIIYGGIKNILNADYWDNSSDSYALQLLYARYNNVINTVFNRAGNSAYNTHPAILVTDAGESYPSIHNRFSGLTATRYSPSHTNTYTYLCEETSAYNDYNRYSDLDGSDCTVGAVRKLGANSKADADDIIGTIATS